MEKYILDTNTWIEHFEPMPGVKVVNWVESG